jgi:hypothetical protein
MSLICIKAQGKTDVKTPPTDSRFFDANQRMKHVPNAPPIQPSTMTPTPLIAAPPAPVSNLSVSDLLVASLLAQSGGLSRILPQFPGSGTRTAPPSPVKRHSVTTEQFCELYDIDDVDCVRLKDVGFRAGDSTDAKVDDDLKEAGFTIFSWRRIHQANLRFKADLAAGAYNA